MLAPHPVRLRSSSNPPRPSAIPPDNAHREMAKEHRDHDQTTPKRKSPRMTSGLLTRAPSTGATRSKFNFRIRRPSSSGGPAVLPKTRSEVFHPPISVPPRPPRNPSRPRPLSSSGIPSTEKLELIASRSTSPVHYVEIPLEHSTSLQSPLTVRKNCVVSRNVSYSCLRLTQSATEVALQRRRSKRQGKTALSAEPAESAPQFSTADRTILEELKQKMKARDSQFKVRSGKKHHPYSPTEVPYPTHYERDVLDNDIWETAWTQRICGSVTWHVFEKPPTRVLDIGCGVGTWILDCARIWKHAQFVGVDIVPLQPDLAQAGTPQLAARIDWVQANFLEGLPFQDEEFDYVHIKRIARGVPEDKWDSLFEEILRVMKPGGALEIIEEDLYFPGRSRYQPDSAITRAYSPTPAHHSTERPRAPTPSSQPRPQSIAPGETPFSRRPPLGKRSNTDPLPPLLSRLPTDPTDEDTPFMEKLVESLAPDSPVEHKPKLPPAPVNPRDHALLEFIYNEMHAVRFVNIQPLSLLVNSLSLYFKDVRTHPPLIASFPPRLPKANTTDFVDFSSSNSSNSSSDDLGITLAPPSARDPTSGHLASSVSLEQLIVRSNPFVTLDESRFSAISPAQVPSSPKFRSPRSQDAPPSDFASTINNAPSHLASEQSQHQALRRTRSKSDIKLYQLPNKQLEFDVSSLNVHLSLRVHEVMACAEAMWDLVIEYRRVYGDKLPKHTSGYSPRMFSRVPSKAPEPIHTALLHMERWDFNVLLEWFQFDMRDHIGLGSAVQKYMGWMMPTSIPPRDDARHEFDKACREWASYIKDPAAYFRAMAYPSRANGSAVPLLPQVINSHSNGADGMDSAPLSPLTPSSPSAFSPLADRWPPNDSGESNRTRSSDGDDVSFPDETDPSERLSRTFRVLVAWKP
ncbi:hypothetical protein K474DRAFT_1258092 [Panus rudis PR-1116 ss-1]|nr:hypothetical protein K474DRAFT_1258092 [Panus rudis PR-1116 ss-1]